MGALGVSIFFVHTCIVLLLSLERLWANQGRTEFFLSFMIRRIFRIYPLSMTVVLVVSALRLPLAEIHTGYFSGTPIHLSNFISNLLLVQSDAHGPSILGPMWSLPYEMGMYLLLPGLFLFLHPTKSLARIFGLWLISISVGLALILFSAHAEANTFLLYVPCFLPGVMAYQLRRTKRHEFPAFLWPGLVVGLVATTLVLRSLFKHDLVLSDWAHKWVMCLVLGLAVPFLGQISARWLVKTAHLIAKYSYGIYLTHYFCIWFVFERLHALLPSMVRLGLFTVLVAGLPVLFYHLLEEPLVLLGKRLVTRSERVNAIASSGDVYVQQLE